MRVAMVTVDFPDRRGGRVGGVGTATVGLVHGLLGVRPDLEVHVIRAPAPDGDSYREGDPPYTVHDVFVRPSRLGSPLPRSPRPQIEALLDALRPDVVHVQAAANYIDASKYPAVLTVHGIPERDTLFRHRHFRNLRARVIRIRHNRARGRYRHIISPAAYVAQTLEASFRGRFHFVPNTIEASFFEVRHQEAGPRILFAGHLTFLKNVHGIIEAVGLLARQQVECTVRLAAQKPRNAYVQRLEALVKKWRIEDRVTFLGSLDRPALQREGQLARCFLLPSFQESSPLTLAEACAMGLPAVVSAAGGSPELVSNGYSGIVVDAHSPASIAAGLRPLLEDPDLARRFGERARERGQLYRPERVAERTLAVYETIMRSGPPGSEEQS